MRERMACHTKAVTTINQNNSMHEFNIFHNICFFMVLFLHNEYGHPYLYVNINYLTVAKSKYVNNI